MDEIDLKNKFLYRYRSMIYRDLDRVFTHCEIFFPSPNSLNDPFDCKFPFTVKDSTEKEIREFLKWIYIDENPKIENNELDIKVNEGYKQFQSNEKPIKKDIIEYLINTLTSNVGRLGIICLSEVYNNILMWSHYADGHRGIVLQREFIKLDNDMMVKHFLLRKSCDWNYEKEWRIFIEPDKRKDFPSSRICKFHKNIVTGVVLGCNITSPNLERIKMWRDYNLPHVKIFKAKKDHETYSVNVSFEEWI